MNEWRNLSNPERKRWILRGFSNIYLSDKIPFRSIPSRIDETVPVAWEETWDTFSRSHARGNSLTNVAGNPLSEDERFARDFCVNKKPLQPNLSGAKSLDGESTPKKVNGPTRV